MEIYYEGAEISQKIEVVELEVQDNCGDRLDAISLLCGDTQGQWSGWGPKKGALLEVAQGGWRSGAMWIDLIRQEQGQLLLGAVSLPPQAKTLRSKSWEAVTLLTLAAEMAAAYGMPLQAYGVAAPACARVDQVNRGDLGFLRWRALLEGCAIKLAQGALVVYDCRYMERQAPAKAWTAASFARPPRFSDSAGETYSACSLSWGGIQGYVQAAGAIGPELTVTDQPVGSQGEAQRFAANLLWDKNKRAASAELYLPLELGVAGGNVVAVSGCGLGDGRYFVELARHDFVAKESTFLCHRCGEAGG